MSGLPATFIVSHLAFQQPTSFCSYRRSPGMSSWNTSYGWTILSGVRCTSCFRMMYILSHVAILRLTVVCSFPAASGSWMMYLPWMVGSRYIIIFQYCQGVSAGNLSLCLFSSTACSVEPQILLLVPQRFHNILLYGIHISGSALSCRSCCFLCFSAKSHRLACRNVVRDRSRLSRTCSFVTNVMTK